MSTTTRPTLQSATARISAGHASSPPRPHHGQRLADAYRPDPALDAVLADPDRRAALSVGARLSLGYYAAAKAAAEAIGGAS